MATTPHCGRPALAATVVLLGGCTTLRPDFHAPQASGCKAGRAALGARWLTKRRAAPRDAASAASGSLAFDLAWELDFCARLGARGALRVRTFPFGPRMRVRRGPLNERA
jgi:hypothetical protein